MGSCGKAGKKGESRQVCAEEDSRAGSGSKMETKGPMERYLGKGTGSLELDN
jgi:hypothetical protein